MLGQPNNAWIYQRHNELKNKTMHPGEKPAAIVRWARSQSGARVLVVCI
jgi:hypothetical protein